MSTTSLKDCIEDLFNALIITVGIGLTHLLLSLNIPLEADWLVGL